MTYSLFIMLTPIEFCTIVQQANDGNTPPRGDLEAAQEVIAFSFGTVFDTHGQVIAPGRTNEAIAAFIVQDEVLRTKNMTLQEEVAIAVEAREPRLAEQIQVVNTIKEPGVAYNTADMIAFVRPGWEDRKIGSVAVLAFRHHMPRASAQVRTTGVQT